MICWIDSLSITDKSIHATKHCCNWANLSLHVVTPKQMSTSNAATSMLISFITIPHHVVGRIIFKRIQLMMCFSSFGTVIFTENRDVTKCCRAINDVFRKSNYIAVNLYRILITVNKYQVIRQLVQSRIRMNVEKVASTYSSRRTPLLEWRKWLSSFYYWLPLLSSQVSFRFVRAIR